MANTVASDCCPPAITAEVQHLRNQSVDLDLITVGGQCYVHVRGLGAPVPPWNCSAYDILIAVPIAAGAALDAFYLELPYTYRSGAHPRVNGNVIEYDGRRWQLVSWHYVDGHPWTFGRDNLDTHITHCKGFFHHRGATTPIS